MPAQVHRWGKGPGVEIHPGHHTLPLVLVMREERQNGQLSHLSKMARKAVLSPMSWTASWCARWQQRWCLGLLKDWMVRVGVRPFDWRALESSSHKEALQVPLVELMSLLHACSVVVSAACFMHVESNSSVCILSNSN
jgi:hypothetical protein